MDLAKHAKMDQVGYPPRKKVFNPKHSASYIAKRQREMMLASTDRDLSGSEHTQSSELSPSDDMATIETAESLIGPSSSDGFQLEQKRSREIIEGTGSSASMISICVILSRITGFARTWAMAFALGATALSSSYQVANNLPNMLYELVMGGMLVTAFLPIYVSVKRKLGDEHSNEYASNLLTLVVLILGIVSIIGMVFPQTIIYTQSFYSDQDTMGTAILLFQFFAIQTVFYGGSSIFSGLLNANRDYLWSSIAPVFNNLVVISTFIAYAFVAPTHPMEALYIIAIGNPLGVFVQMAIQIPALKRNGIRLKLRVDLRDPYLIDTLKLGIPAALVMVFSFITVSVMNAASYAFADNGPSIIIYARLWYTLPYSFLAIPITTELFTELSHMEAIGDEEGEIVAISSGISQIMFLLIPFMLYLIVFSTPLVTIYHIGAFSSNDIGIIAGYLCALALALPFYGVNAYLQKIFSSIRHMGIFAIIIGFASVVQIVLTMGAVFLFDNGYSFSFPTTIPITIESIAIASAIFYVISDAISLIYLKAHFGHIGFLRIFISTILGIVLGALGALGGYGVLVLLQTFIAPLSGSIWQALGYVVLSGIVSLIITFGLAAIFKVKEASLINSMVSKVFRRLIHR